MPRNHPPSTLDFYRKTIWNGFIARTVEELLCARVAAFSMLAAPTSGDQERAENFLKATMTIDEKDYQFEVKREFVRGISRFDAPIILCIRDDEEIRVVFYRINYYIGQGEDEQQLSLHEVSFFKKELFSSLLFPQQNYRFMFTHKFDLLKALRDWQANHQAKPLPIRQIGDLVLHRPAQRITDFSQVGQQEIMRQIDLLKEALRSTGGVGIAANQCGAIASPLSIVMVGVDYNDRLHVARAHDRYPGVVPKPMECFLNLEILEQSQSQVEFSEGCLSVAGGIRASMWRSEWVRVVYQNLSGQRFEKVFTGMDARVMLHELDHIVFGEVFLTRVVAELDREQVRQLLDLVERVLPSNPPMDSRVYARVPVVVFERDGSGRWIINDQAESLLKDTALSALRGLEGILHKRLKVLSASRDLKREAANGAAGCLSMRSKLYINSK